VAWLVSDARVLASVEVASDRRDRRHGLLGRNAVDGAFVLRPCRWVHTIGMRFPLDVAFVAADGTVVRITRMARHRIGAPTPRAAWVIEATAGAFERWGLAVGDTVELRDGDEPAADVETGDGRAAG
jgi:uncharacterized membrane protein (UPF0127 family)